MDFYEENQSLGTQTLDEPGAFETENELSADDLDQISGGTPKVLLVAGAVAAAPWVSGVVRGVASRFLRRGRKVE